jgi:hypothetical protein
LTSESILPSFAEKLADFEPETLCWPTSSGRAWVVASADRIPSELRKQAFAAHSKDFRYYELLEETLPDQFEYRYLVLANETTSEWAIQPIFFVIQDLLAGLPQGVRSLFAPARKVWPGLLKFRMLVIGCAAGEGQLDHSAPWIAPALWEAIEAYRRKARASIILLKDFPSCYRDTLGRFSCDGYQRAPSLPAAMLSLDFASFEEFMAGKLSKTFRKNLRRKLRASESGAPIEMEVVTDAAPHANDVYQLHLQTFNRSDFQFEKLTRDFFARIGQRLPERVRFFLWRREGRIIAFNLCIVHDGTLYDLGVGMDYSVALDLHLYFRTWRDVIQWCLENGIGTYHTGPLNYDPKAHLRLKLVPQDLYARHNSALLNPLFKLAIKYLEPTRHDPVLKRFANACELRGWQG